MKNPPGRKIIILIGDGMADLPIDELGGKTPLEYADTPNMDALCREGICGLAATVPPGMSPGSDTANLSIFGYNPAEWYPGRAPLEAVNMDIPLSEKDAVFRCNIITAPDGIMKDFSGGHIESEFSKIVIDELNAAIDIPDIEFHAGVSYRHILVWRNYPYENITGSTPPHDIHGLKTADYLPSGDGSDILRNIMAVSKEIIKNSDIIQKNISRFKGEPESVWLWGGGRKPSIAPLKKMYGLDGYTISAVDLIHGIGKAAGLKSAHVPGATGYLDTDYNGKVQALFSSLESSDFVYLHVEAPDESGHEGNLKNKLTAIEDFDKKVVGPVVEGLYRYSEYSLLVMPDHPTPLATRTHSSDPVPFCMTRTGGFTGAPDSSKVDSYCETSAESAALLISKGHRLIELMITGNIREVQQ